MRAVVQRVSRASVEVAGEIIGAIDQGFLVLLGVSKEDKEQDAQYIAAKVTGLRVFDDSNDQLNLALADIGGKVLLISQFTLYGDARKGRRPSFVHAAGGAQANALYERVAELIRESGIDVKMGAFGAEMHVSLVNDGPVTILLDSTKGF